MEDEMSGYPRAVVRREDDRLVLEDSDALLMADAINKHDCLGTLKFNVERIAHFQRRISMRGKTPDDLLIVLLNVNDPMGESLADVLMPGYDWDAIRETGALPFARGLVSRPAMQDILDELDKGAAEILKSIQDEVAVLVMDHGVVTVFKASQAFE